MSHAWSYMRPTRGAICVPRVELYVSHAWDNMRPMRGTSQVPRVKRVARHGMRRMLGGLRERKLPFKRVKTAVGSFMLPSDACLTLPSGRLRHVRRKVSSMRLYRSQVSFLMGTDPLKRLSTASVIMSRAREDSHVSQLQNLWHNFLLNHGIQGNAKETGGYLSVCSVYSVVLQLPQLSSLFPFQRNLPTFTFLREARAAGYTAIKKALNCLG